MVLFGLWKEDMNQEENRKLVYVGMTRATDHLTVVTVRSNPLVKDLKNAIAR